MWICDMILLRDTLLCAVLCYKPVMNAMEIINLQCPTVTQHHRAVM